MTRFASLFVAGIMLAGLLACGGGGGGGGGGQPAGSTKVTLSDYKFTPSNLSAKPGKVGFFLVNTGSQSHDMAVLGSDGKSLGKSDLVQPGDSSVFTIGNLPAGSYRVICDQPGHEEAGMKGTLTVG